MKMQKKLSQGISYDTALCTAMLATASMLRQQFRCCCSNWRNLAFSAYDLKGIFSFSTSDIYVFGKENNIENILEKAKDSLGT